MLINIIVLTYLIISVLIFSFDFIITVYEHMLHSSHGNWNNQERWKQAVYGITVKWVKKCPSLRLKKERRYLLIDKVMRKSSKRMVQSWQLASCMLAVTEAEHDSTKRQVDIRRFLSEDGTWKAAPDKVDYGMLSYTVLRIASEDKVQWIKPAMDQMVACIRKNKGLDGTISYSMGTKSPRRYVDTLGFVCPFLALYGTVFDDLQYVELSINLIRKYFQEGCMDNLPFHCYRIDSGEPLGVYAWGRGTGWLMLALVDSWSSIKESDKKAQLEEIIEAIGERCVSFEMEDGGFSSILPEMCKYDSSATAMIGYFYAKAGKILGRKEYFDIAERCVIKLMKETNSFGMVDHCQGDTIDLGIFSDNYSFMPFAQGMALRLANCMTDYKMESL